MRFIYSKTFAYLAASLVVIAVVVFLQSVGKLDRIRAGFLYAPRPVMTVSRAVVLPIKNFFSILFSLRSLASENGVLRNKIFFLEQELAKLEQEKIENVALRKELEFSKTSSLQLIPCSVITQNIFDYNDTVSLNCGTSQGVNEGKALVSQGFFAGKIIHADEHTSTALLLTSSKFKTDARLSKTGVNAVARGSFNAGIFLEQIPQDSAVEKGWLVVTAGISEKIPKNLSIGEVGEIASASNDLFKSATLVSPLDFKNLEFVFVIN